MMNLKGALKRLAPLSASERLNLVLNYIFPSF
jgi:hypothetical protein